MKAALVAASVLPVIMTAVAMFFLPDTVAFHFGANGEPDAWNSKPTLFVGAGIATVCNLIMVGLYQLGEKQKKTGVEYLVMNKPLPLWLCWVILVVMDVVMLLPLLYNLGLVGTVALGPALTVTFAISAVVVFVIGIQLFRGKWLNHINTGTDDPTKVKGDDYWGRAGKAIGIFLMILAVALAVLAFMVSQ